MANVSHNDLKPSNFLVDWPQGITPTVFNLEVFLTDFGMVDQSGGTPIYCSPEGLTGTIVGVSDLFSLGRVFTFLVMENTSLFYTLLFTSILIPTYLESVRNVITSFPIMNLIREMTHIEKRKRIQIRHVKQMLADIKLEIVKRKVINSQLVQGHTGITALNQDNQVKRMMQER